MSEIEKLVRRRMEEEYAKGTSADRISQLVKELLNSLDMSETETTRLSHDQQRA
ncbi:hypothetical protein [Oryzifoliimicrobium ureilyticus]|uniref:hypothetical protein n=1 Tax=Oryzifoliimicrobium ureilyticus TaxID=3113724 RepID=UPI0030763B07